VPYELPPLPYAYNALEPHIDELTMQIHHDRHHQAYVDNANKALEGTEWADKPVEDVLRNIDQVPEDIRTAVRNNAGGHANHTLFWEIMTPGGPQVDTTWEEIKSIFKLSDLASAVDGAFGSFDTLKEQVTAAGIGRFGSGWAWVVWDGSSLSVTSTPNQDSPLSDGLTPVLGVDVWEHAYYLSYQNRRPEYLSQWWSVVNWAEVEKRLKAAG
jgi:Fe-Mn family superoxide dismutase